MLCLSGAGEPSGQWLQATLQLLAAETSEEQPGSPAVVRRLMEVLFVQAVRTCIEDDRADCQVSWLRALADPRIASALRLMHARPEHGWTVPKLAREVSLSRSAFAAKFKALVGTGPLEHLTKWRMLRAASLLRMDRGRKLAAVAAAIGYDSDTAFSKAFRREMGVSPGEYRRRHLAGPRE
jgi:transcriptional regulator GlxA family with amidase domain